MTVTIFSTIRSNNKTEHYRILIIMKKLSSWRFWDWKSIGKTSLVFAILAIGGAMVKYYPSYSKNSNLEKLPASTYALVNKVRPIKHVDMDFDGNKVYVRGYEIGYYYTIDTVTYQSSDYLSNTADNQEILKKIHSDKEQTIQIAYDPKAPIKTQIIVK